MLLENDVRGPTAIRSPTANAPLPSPSDCTGICNKVALLPVAVAPAIVVLGPFDCIDCGSAVSYTHLRAHET